MTVRILLSDFRLFRVNEATLIIRAELKQLGVMTATGHQLYNRATVQG